MRVVRRRPAAVLAATVLGLGVLSGCGGEASDEPSTSTSTASPIPVDPSSSSSSSSSSGGSSSSSTKGGDGSVDLPEAATKHTQEGAVAFAKYYWGESGKALQSGDPAVMRELSNDCPPCDRFAELVEEDQRKGLRADADPITIGSSRVTDQTNEKSDEAVVLDVEQAEYMMVDSDGQAHARARAAEYDLTVYLDWDESGWRVVDMFQTLK